MWATGDGLWDAVTGLDYPGGLWGWNARRGLVIRYRINDGDRNNYLDTHARGGVYARVGAQARAHADVFLLAYNPLRLSHVGYLTWPDDDVLLIPGADVARQPGAQHETRTIFHMAGE